MLHGTLSAIWWFGQPGVQINEIQAGKLTSCGQVPIAAQDQAATTSPSHTPARATARRADLIQFKRRVASEFGEAVRCPLLRADSVVDEKKAVGIVFLFDFGEASVIGAPVSMFEGGFKEVAF
jgi:hypothetical protein